jgi:hypothetical protein
VFNPFSLLSFLKLKRLLAYWYFSGVPKFLIDTVKNNPQSFIETQNASIDELSLDSVELTEQPLISLLFQTGYLTVDTAYYEEQNMTYGLRLPNREVREAFNRQVLETLTGASNKLTTASWKKMRAALAAGEPEKLAEILQGLFASIPYHLHLEAEAYYDGESLRDSAPALCSLSAKAHPSNSLALIETSREHLYHSIFFAVMQVLDFKMSSEVAVSLGRIDGILEMPGKVYIIEMKYHKGGKRDSAEKRKTRQNNLMTQALEQIESRGYADKYSGSGLQVYKVAIAVVGRSDVACRAVR